MRFPNVKINRKIGIPTLYFSSKYKFLISDPGYEFGDIYLYELKEKRHSDDLYDILEEYLNGEELENFNIIEIKEVKENSIKSEILKTKHF